MSVAQLPGGEIVPAMERGVIDAYEFNNPSSDLRFGSADVAKNYYLGSYHQASREPSSSCSTATSSTTSSPTCRRSCKHAVEAASSANTYFALKNYSADLQKLQNELGVTVHRTPKDILEAQLEAWDVLIAQLEQDEFMKRIIDSQRAWVERVTYYELMNAPDYTLAYDHYFPGKLKLTPEPG